MHVKQIESNVAVGFREARQTGKIFLVSFAGFCLHWLMILILKAVSWFKKIRISGKEKVNVQTQLPLQSPLLQSAKG